MKRFLILIFCLMVILPTCVFAAKKNKNLVNVYIFEAGGCPACQKQVEYLKKLPSYNKKFKIVIKELYVDTADWAQGKDYKVGSSVASLFYGQGYTDASINATPFMVISDLYAATGTFTSDKLEEIIDQAYKEGDKDVVKCVESGKSKCLSKDAKPVVEPKPTTTTTTTTTTSARTLSDKEKSNNGFVVLIVLGIALIFIFISRKGNADYDEDEDDNEVDSDEEDIDDEEDDDDELDDEETESKDEAKEEIKDTKKENKQKEVKKTPKNSKKKNVSKKK